MNQKFTWLHLSDFHVGLDEHGQTQLFQYIINHVKEKNKNPDFIFITGDIAQSGLEKEYEKFGTEFIEPLQKNLSENCKIFVVAGNHDTDRNKQKFFTPSEILNTTNFFDPTKQGLENRQFLLPRFEKYRDFQQLYFDGDWLNSEKGYFVYQDKLNDIQLGIVGINTAWLSKDNNDKGNLTAGKAIIESALTEIQNCEVKIILGHHPLDWFYDNNPIRSLFAKNQIIYLHGHLHEGNKRYEESAGHQFLAIQSGASFQGREDEKWINGLLWAELDFANKSINLEPYKWKRNNQEWGLDSDAFDEVFRNGGVWKLPLPQKIQTPANTSKPAIKQHKPFSTPQGWEIIDLGSLNKRKSEPDEETILKYFDGRIPNWSLALSNKIPRRQIVDNLTKKINDYATANKSSITILLGAGGEGKSTAFLQTIEAILNSANTWKVLYHKEENSQLSKSVMNDLPSDTYWLIASDDADLIAEDIYQAAQTQKGHIHFLLAARDTDWYDPKLEKLKWNTAFSKSYHEERLSGLIAEDAQKIVQAWANYQQDGLGKLADLPIDQAAQKLLNEAKSDTKQEGTFFGALLRVRYGDDLKEHIRKLLNRLRERQVKDCKYNLLQAFAYIAAMHAENQLFLSKLVLASLLEIEQGKLRSKVLHPLGEEAAASMAGEYVFTRHRAIAQTTVQILEEETVYGIDIDEIYIELVTTAESIYQKGNYVTNLAGWRYLSDHFFAKGSNTHNLAIRLSQSLLNLDKTNSYLQVKLAQQFRKAGQPEQAIKVFRKSPIVNDSRSFFSEWGVDEGIEDCHALSVYLTGYSLADEATKKFPTNDDAKICLNGLSIALSELFKKYNRAIFIEACGAAALLGLNVKYLDDKTKRELLKSKQTAAEFSITETSLQVALKRIQEVMQITYNQREADLPDWLLKPDDLHFEGLKYLLGI
jgi:predicted phosphodiesterase